MIQRQRKPLLWLLLVLALGLLSGPVCTSRPPGSTEQVASAPAAAALPGKITEQRDRWTEQTLNWVAETLGQNPPGSGDASLRRLALITLDDPLHLLEAPRMETVGRFFRRMIDQALDQISRETVREGAVIWKLYNHSFVIKTSGHTFAFDIFRGMRRVSMTEEQLQRLADLADVLFITHYHNDHADYGFAEMLVARGKKVVIPVNLWQDTEIENSLVRTPGGTEGNCSGIEFKAFPGHQGDIPNNVYLVTTDNFTVMHTGDQSNSNDFDLWIDGLGDRYQVDLLLPNCWTTDLPRLVREVNPKVVITGHENELGHEVYKRESYQKTFQLIRGLENRCQVMGWGERFSYQRSGGSN